MNKFNMGRFITTPERGTMLIWPSFLPHAVERGSAKTNEDRIVVAFNVMIRGKIENPTAYLDLK
jgi:hypothetical protein